MEVVNGSWTMYGLDSTDSRCLHKVEEAERLIEEIGMLPLFGNEIKGFSLEERTASQNWWCGNPLDDPWMWRTVIAKRHNIIYGKFFAGKTGFISKELVPDFVNYRRDGYDFDALFDDGKAPMKHRKIMLNFMDDNADNMIMSNELKIQSGFGKGGEKGYDGAITSLMMQTYLCNSDFTKRVNKKGEEFGWEVAEYATPEHILGYEYVTSRYNCDPKESFERIVNRVKKFFPEATEKQLLKVLR